MREACSCVTMGALLLVADNAERPMSGTKPAVMLALLTIHANQRVSVDPLMDAASGERSPPVPPRR